MVCKVLLVEGFWDDYDIAKEAVIRHETLDSTPMHMLCSDVLRVAGGAQQSSHLPPLCAGLDLRFKD